MTQFNLIVKTLEYDLYQVYQICADYMEMGYR